MCGLIGVIGESINCDKKMFDYLLQLDVPRGPHSTGVCKVYRDQERIPIIKALGTYWDFINKEWESYYEGTPRDIKGNYDVLMGHNRWATVGGVTENNAHPFHAKNLIGCQNGTIPQEHLKNIPNWFRYETDTEALLNAINVHGVEFLSTIRGAWALTYYDIDKGTFNIIRNNERPLFYAYHQTRKVLYYASEAWMLSVAAHKHNVDIGEIRQFDEDILHTFDLSEVGGVSEDRVVTKEVKPLALPKSLPFPRASKVYSNLWRGDTVEFYLVGEQKDVYGKAYLGGRTWGSDDEIRIYNVDKRLEDIFADPSVHSYSGIVREMKYGLHNWQDDYALLSHNTIKKISTTDFNKWVDEIDKEAKDGIHYRVNGMQCDHDSWLRATETGCAWCTGMIGDSEKDKIVWIDNTTFVCEDCSCDENVIPYLKTAI